MFPQTQAGIVRRRDFAHAADRVVRCSTEGLDTAHRRLLLLYVNLRLHSVCLLITLQYRHKPLVDISRASFAFGQLPYLSRDTLFAFSQSLNKSVYYTMILSVSARVNGVL